MPLVIIFRLLGSLLSLAVLGAAAYLGWRWYEGAAVLLADGSVMRIREDWQIWTAIGLLGISLFGRLLIAPFLGRPDDERTELTLRRGDGATIESSTLAKLYVEERGARALPTLVFTHGWGLDSTIWAYAKRDLEDEFRLIFWDLPGAGKSRPCIDGKLDPTRFAKDLQAVIAQVSEEKVVLIGHSIGGMTIQSLLREAPDYVREKVAGIVLLNTTYTNPLKTMAFSGFFRSIRWVVLEPALWLASLLQPLVWLDAWRTYLSGWAHVANRVQFGKTVTRSQLEAVTLLGTRNPQGAIAKGNLGMFRWDGAGVLSGAPCPVLIMGGEDDLVTKPDASRDMAASAPGSELTLIDDVNHNGFLENFEAYNCAIAEFARTAFAKANAKATQDAISNDSNHRIPGTNDARQDSDFGLTLSGSSVLPHPSSAVAQTRPIPPA